VDRRDVGLGSEVTLTPLQEGVDSLLVVQPKGDLNGAAWAHENRAVIERTLLAQGAVLFRGFGVVTAEQFGNFAKAISTDFPCFAEESSPRSQVVGPVYTSTDYPAAYPIQFHNEFSYANEWPRNLCFACLTPPATGGETPIADSRAVLRRLAPATREAFRTRKVMYTRNFRPGVGVSWQTAFQTKEKSAVEAYCQAGGIPYEWLRGDGLRTRQVQDAIVMHPVTQEDVWFNHGFFFNIEALEPVEIRDLLRAEGEGNWPTNTCFGDGEPIPREWLEQIRRAYLEEAVRFRWQRGDVLLIDNMLTSHARAAFTGERRIVVVMGGRWQRQDLGRAS
jgi:alpha-ketoglutarate-dependent taurine dioxygenase